jgi:hypothetical protein
MGKFVPSCHKNDFFWDASGTRVELQHTKSKFMIYNK